MDVLDMAKVLESGDLWTGALIAALAAVPLAKGIFAVRKGQHQRRKEFIDFWRDTPSRRCDLWLEEIVQHRYGSAPSARLIRHIISLKRPSYKLHKVAMTASFFDLDEESGEMAWVRPQRKRLGWFFGEVIACGVGYFILATVGVGLVMAGNPFRTQNDFVLAFFGVNLTIVACLFFWHLFNLVEARATIGLVNGESR